MNGQVRELVAKLGRWVAKLGRLHGSVREGGG
jgi:hypothetical protein